MQLPRASEKVELGDGNAIEYVAAAATRKGSATAIVLFTIFVRREAKIAQIQIGHWSERTQHVAGDKAPVRFAVKPRWMRAAEIGHDCREWSGAGATAVGISAPAVAIALPAAAPTPFT